MSSMSVTVLAVLLLAMALAFPADGQQPSSVVDHTMSGKSSPVDLKKMIARLGAEADAFERTAYRIAGRELLKQTVPNGVRMGRGLRGTFIKLPGYSREIVSEYGFVSVDAPGGSVREVRRVLMVDGQKWQKESKSLKALARDMMAVDDKARQRSLERFEEFGLTGFITDLGQLILLFARGNAAHFEFVYESAEADGTLVFTYQQVDGAEAVTIYGETSIPVKQKMHGRLWIQPYTLLPLRMSLDSQREYESQWLVDRSLVEYAPSKFGLLLPMRIRHDQHYGQTLLVTDDFDYSEWKQVLPSVDRKK